MTDALAAISGRIGELETKLATSPIYRELKILCKARDDLGRLSESGTYSTKAAIPPPHLGPKRITILEGVRLALAEKCHPMTTAELVEILPQFGTQVGGKKPRTNLTSVLSKRGESIVSVRWKSKHMWWFRDRPLPDDEAEGTSSEVRPSAPNSNQGESYAPALVE